jgi:hypothetical protein
MLALLLSTFMLAAAPAGPCTQSQLTLHVGPSDGTAGTIYHPLTFTNTSATACTLRGYPGVSSRSGKHGSQVGSPASRDSRPVHTVLLAAHGGAATAAYGQVDTGVFSKAKCKPVKAHGLRVYAPGQTGFFYASLTHEACSKAGAGDSHVRPVVAGKTGL